MAKESDRRFWEENYRNKVLSGIEVQDKNGKLVNFITIIHDEILGKHSPHRITIKLDENAKPILPSPQTFEQIIQSKRQQQMLLYGSGNSSTGAPYTDRTARRVTSVARRVTAVARRVTAVARRRTSIPMSPSAPAVPSAPSPPAAVTPQTVSTMQSVTTLPSGSAAPSSNSPVDPKEVKLLLKSAPPGASVILPNGTVIQKSRRGGARAGAGRKRCRPTATDQLMNEANMNDTSRDQESESNQQLSTSTENLEDTIILQTQ